MSEAVMREEPGHRIRFDAREALVLEARNASSDLVAHLSPHISLGTEVLAHQENRSAVVIKTSTDYITEEMRLSLSCIATYQQGSVVSHPCVRARAERSNIRGGRTNCIYPSGYLLNEPFPLRSGFALGGKPKLLVEFAR